MFKIKLLLFILFFINISLSSEEKFMAHDGKGDHIRSTPEEKSLEFYLDSLSLYSHEIRNKIKSYTLDTIGEINSHIIIDLRFQSNRPVNNKSKAILYESSPNKYIILQLTVDFMGQLEFSYILEIDSIMVLVTKSRYGGNMSFYLEDYWAWNYSKNNLSNLEVFGLTKDTLKYILPLNTGFPIGGKFDIELLEAKGFVAHKDDHMYSPSAGSITINYKLNDSGLFIDKVDYQPDSVYWKAK